MPPAVERMVPMAYVQSVGRSIRFYQQLGFEAVNTFTPPDLGEPGWAYLSCGAAHLMLTAAEGGERRGCPGILFYLYARDVPAIHRQLTEAGLVESPMETPFYSPLGEFRLTDPDGYVIVVTHVEEPGDDLPV